MTEYRASSEFCRICNSNASAIRTLLAFEGASFMTLHACALFLDTVPDSHMQVLRDFSELLFLAFRQGKTETDIGAFERKAELATERIFLTFYKNNPAGFSPSFHMLLHLGESFRETGDMSNTDTWSYERKHQQLKAAPSNMKNDHKQVAVKVVTRTALAVATERAHRASTALHLPPCLLPQSKSAPPPSFSHPNRGSQLASMGRSDFESNRLDRQEPDAVRDWPVVMRKQLKSESIDAHDVAEYLTLVHNHDVSASELYEMRLYKFCDVNGLHFQADARKAHRPNRPREHHLVKAAFFSASGDVEHWYGFAEFFITVKYRERTHRLARMLWYPFLQDSDTTDALRLDNATGHAHLSKKACSRDRIYHVRRLVANVIPLPFFEKPGQKRKGRCRCSGGEERRSSTFLAATVSYFLMHA
eukprot:m.275238 g.275238  ORF g.275238 m.275238 type:complete len:418 (+) comp11092_c0_seq2:1999-3252(+)